MSFCWQHKNGSLDVTHSGMFTIRLALGAVGALDGPPDPRFNYRWILKNPNGMDSTRQVVRVNALRFNDHKLSEIECSVISDVLGLYLDSEKGLEKLRGFKMPFEQAKDFFASVSAFMKEASELEGCWDGEGDQDAGAWRNEAPKFEPHETTGEKAVAAANKLVESAKSNFSIQLSFDENALREIDSLVAREFTDEKIGQQLSAFYLEVLRRLHGGEWGKVLPAGFPGIKLESGVVCTLGLVSFRVSELGPFPFSLKEFASKPVQLPGGMG